MEALYPAAPAMETLPSQLPVPTLAATLAEVCRQRYNMGAYAITPRPATCSSAPVSRQVPRRGGLRSCPGGGPKTSGSRLRLPLRAAAAAETGELSQRTSVDGPGPACSSHPWRVEPDLCLRGTDFRGYSSLQQLLDPSWEDASQLVSVPHGGLLAPVADASAVEAAVLETSPFNRVGRSASGLTSGQPETLRAASKGAMKRAITTSMRSPQAREEREQTSLQVPVDVDFSVVRMSNDWKSAIALTSSAGLGSGVVMHDDSLQALFRREAAEAEREEQQNARPAEDRPASPVKPGIYIGHDPNARQGPWRLGRAAEQHLLQPLLQLQLKALGDGLPEHRPRVGGRGQPPCVTDGDHADGPEESSDGPREPQPAKGRPGKPTWTSFRKMTRTRPKVEDLQVLQDRKDLDEWKRRVFECARNLQMEVCRFQLD